MNTHWYTAMLFNYIYVIEILNSITLFEYNNKVVYLFTFILLFTISANEETIYILSIMRLIYERIIFTMRCYLYS